MRTLSTALLILIFSISANSADWTWEGFEIIGQKKVSKAEIQSQIPIQIGAVFFGNKPLWDQWCNSIKSKYQFIYAECSAVRYSNFKAYFTVEIVEKGDEFRLAFRAEPTQSIPLADPQVISEFDALQKRMWELFEQGSPAMESTSKGYLDYSDTEMSQIVQSLVKLVPKYRENLLRVLEFAQDSNQRAKAATLLNWALNTEDSISRVHSFVDDPNGLVRNNVSRFMLHYFDGVNSSQVRRDVISSLSQQLWLPTHLDEK